jgi:hypothetical protein
MLSYTLEVMCSKKRGNSCVVVEGQKDTAWYHIAKKLFEYQLLNRPEE